MIKPKQVKPIDIREIFTILMKRKWLLIVPIIIIGSIAYAGTFFMAPKFKASTIVWIDRPANASSELERILGGTNRRETRDEQYNKRLALETEITSQGYLTKLISELNLDDDPEISRDAAKMRESNPDVPLERIKHNLLIQKLRDGITVRWHGTDQIIITVESGIPARAKDIASRLTEILAEEKSNYEMQKILDNQSFTDVQLQKSERFYRLAVDSLDVARARLQKLQLPENISSESNRRDIISSIDKIRLDSDDYIRDKNAIDAQLRDFNLESKRLKFTDEIIELRTTIEGLVSSYANMMEKYTWNDQNIININIRLNDNNRMLEQAITESVDNQYSTLPENQKDMLKRNFITKENVDILNSKTKRLQQSLSKIDNRINTIPRLESQIDELVIQVEDSRKYRDAFKTEGTTVGLLSERAKERTTYKVIEPAKIPLLPFWPNKKKILMIGIAMGLLLGCAAVFLFELLDNSFKRIEDIEEELGIPVIATIPRIDKFQINR